MNRIAFHIEIVLALVRARFVSVPIGEGAVSASGDAGSTSITPEAVRIARGVHAVATGLGLRNACLIRARALWLLLNRRGIPAVLEVGVRTRRNGLQAHAWVRMGPEILIGNLPDLSTYKTLQDHRVTL